MILNLQTGAPIKGKIVSPPFAIFNPRYVQTSFPTAEHLFNTRYVKTGLLTANHLFSFAGVPDEASPCVLSKSLPLFDWTQD